MHICCPLPRSPAELRLHRSHGRSPDALRAGAACASQARSGAPVLQQGRAPQQPALIRLAAAVGEPGVDGVARAGRAGPRAAAAGRAAVGQPLRLRRGEPEVQARGRGGVVEQRAREAADLRPRRAPSLSGPAARGPLAQLAALPPGVALMGRGSLPGCATAASQGAPHLFVCDAIPLLERYPPAACEKSTQVVKGLRQQCALAMHARAQWVSCCTPRAARQEHWSQGMIGSSADRLGSGAKTATEAELRRRQAHACADAPKEANTRSAVSRRCGAHSSAPKRGGMRPRRRRAAPPPPAAGWGAPSGAALGAGAGEAGAARSGRNAPSGSGMRARQPTAAFTWRSGRPPGGHERRHEAWCSTLAVRLRAHRPPWTTPRASRATQSRDAVAFGPGRARSGRHAAVQGRRQPGPLKLARRRGHWPAGVPRALTCGCASQGL